MLLSDGYNVQPKITSVVLPEPDRCVMVMDEYIDISLALTVSHVIIVLLVIREMESPNNADIRWILVPGPTRLDGDLWVTLLLVQHVTGMVLVHVYDER